MMSTRQELALAGIVTLVVWVGNMFAWLGNLFEAVPVALRAFIVLSVADLITYTVRLIAEANAEWRSKLTRYSLRRLAHFVAILAIVVAADLLAGRVDDELESVMRLASQAASVWGILLVTIEMLETLAALGLPLPRRLRELFQKFDENGREPEQRD